MEFSRLNLKGGSAGGAKGVGGAQLLFTQSQITVCLLQVPKWQRCKLSATLVVPSSLFQAFLAPFHKTVSLISLLSSGWCGDHRVLVRSVDCSWKVEKPRSFIIIVFLSFLTSFWCFLFFFFYNKFTQTRKSKTKKRTNRKKEKGTRGAQTVEFLKSIHPNSKALICQWAVHWYYLQREKQESEQVRTAWFILTNPILEIGCICIGSISQMNSYMQWNVQIKKGQMVCVRVCRSGGGVSASF